MRGLSLPIVLWYKAALFAQSLPAGGLARCRCGEVGAGHDLGGAVGGLGSVGLRVTA